MDVSQSASLFLEFASTEVSDDLELFAADWHTARPHGPFHATEAITRSQAVWAGEVGESTVDFSHSGEHPGRAQRDRRRL